MKTYMFTLVALFLVGLPFLASGQIVVFEEDFEGNIEN